MKTIIIGLALIFLCAHPLCAETIVFEDGARLQVKEYRINGDKIECYVAGSWQAYPFSSVRDIESGELKKKPRKNMGQKHQEKKPEMTHLIILKDGQTIIVKELWEETDGIQYMKYGSMVSVKKELIQDIQWIEKSEVTAYKDKKVQKKFNENANANSGSNDAIKRLAHESKIRSLKAAGRPARFVKEGMTKEDVFELAGEPTSRTNGYISYSKCKNVYDEIWNYSYGRYINYAIYFADHIVVCPPVCSTHAREYNPKKGRSGIMWITPN